MGEKNKRIEIEGQEQDLEPKQEEEIELKSEPEQKVPESEQKLEKLEEEPSPEIIEKIMDKVQDIDANGTAYTYISDPLFFESLEKDDVSERTRLIFEHGKFGFGTWKWLIDSEKLNFSDAIKERRKVRNQEGVYFNIIGRSMLNDDIIEKEQGKSSEIPSMIRSVYTENGISIIFDKSFIREVSLNDYRNFYSEKFKPKVKEYFADFNSGDSDYRKISWDKINSLNEVKIDSSWGFYTRSRIPPRSFRGIVISRRFKPKYPGFTYSHPEQVKIIDESEEELKRLSDVAKKLKKLMIELYKEKPELLLPIYDICGNLLYPKQMNYEEVKKFVEERDKDKRKQKEKE